MKKIITICISAAIGICIGISGTYFCYKNIIQSKNNQMQSMQDEIFEWKSKYNELLDNWYGLEGEYNELAEKLNAYEGD